jgi:hypothetical protein
MKTDKSGAHARYDWNGDGTVNHDDVTFHVHELTGAGTSAHTLLAFQKSGGELTAADLIEFAQGGNNVGVSDLERFVKQGGELTGADVAALADAGVAFEPEDITRLESRDGIKFSDEDKQALEGKGIKLPTHQDVTDFIAKAKQGDSAEGILALQKKSGRVSVADLIAFQEKSGAVKGEDVVAYARAGGRLAPDDVFALMDHGVKVSGDELVSLERAGVAFTDADLTRFTKAGGTLTDRNSRSFEKLGVSSPQGSGGAIPEGTTWGKLKEMMDAGVKVHLKDVMDYLDAHPEIKVEAAHDALGPLPFMLQKDHSSLPPDFDHGDLVRYLVEKKHVTVSKDDVFALQKKHHCFSGWSLADFSEHNGLRLKAADLVKLTTEMDCHGFDKKVIKRIEDACHIKLSPSQYLTLTA